MSMVDIYIFNADDALLSMKWNHRLIMRIFNSLINSVKARIISLALLCLIYVVRMVLQSYLVYIHDVDVFISFSVRWGRVRIDRSKFYLPLLYLGTW